MSRTVPVGIVRRKGIVLGVFDGVQEKAIAKFLEE